MARATAEPMYEAVLRWVEAVVRPQGYARPLCKRLAVLVSALVAGDRATVGALSASVGALGVSAAQEESIARRLQRTLGDPRLDPARLLPALFGAVLPDLLSGQVAAHAANVGSGHHHQRFVGVVLVIDESSQEDDVHLLVAGVPMGGVVVPLALRCWAQNAPLPEGAYGSALAGLVQEVQAMLPPVLREHVLLVADRGYGVPRTIDLATALGWRWLLRVQGQTRVRMPDGTECALAHLCPRRGVRRLGESPTGTADGLVVPQAAVFKKAGWRAGAVLAVWAPAQAEPWLLVTNLPATRERVADYARRWSIERLFLSWKSRGWDVETSGVRDPQRLARLLSGLAIATLWRLAIALPHAQAHLAALTARAQRPGTTPRQLRLPGFSAPPRPWVAKFSLFSWGARIAQMTPLRTHTPALAWSFPAWHASTWSDLCRLASHSDSP